MGGEKRTSDQLIVAIGIKEIWINGPQHRYERKSRQVEHSQLDTQYWGLGGGVFCILQGSKMHLSGTVMSAGAHILHGLTYSTCDKTIGSFSRAWTTSTHTLNHSNRVSGFGFLDKRMRKDINFNPNK